MVKLSSNPALLSSYALSATLEGNLSRLPIAVDDVRDTRSLDVAFNWVDFQELMTTGENVNGIAVSTIIFRMIEEEHVRRNHADPLPIFVPSVLFTHQEMVMDEKPDAHGRRRLNRLNFHEAFGRLFCSFSIDSLHFS